MLATALLLVPLLGAAQVTEIATNWQCQPIAQIVGQPRGFWELEKPLRPVFSIPAVSEILGPTPTVGSPNAHPSGILTAYLLDGRFLSLNPRALSPAKVLQYGGWTLAATSLGGEYATVYLDDGSVNVVDLLTGELRPLFSADITDIGTLAFGPNGDYLARVTPDGALEIWSLGQAPTLEARLDVGRGGPSQVVFSPSGTRLAIAGQDGVTVLGWEAGALISLFDFEESEAHPFGTVAGAVEGREYFAIGYSSGAVQATGFDGERLLDYQIFQEDTPGIVSVAVDPDSGALLAYTMRGELLLASNLSSESSRWSVPGVTVAVFGALLLGDMDSALVSTVNFTESPFSIIGYTKGDRWPRFVLEGFEELISGMWDLGEMGILVAAKEEDGSAGVYRICRDDLLRAFASRSAGMG